MHLTPVETTPDFLAPALDQSAGDALVHEFLVPVAESSTVLDGWVTMTLGSQFCSSALDDTGRVFHHRATDPSIDSDVTISVLEDGAVRVLHRCDGQDFELRGGRVVADRAIEITYSWGTAGSRLTVDQVLVDESAAVLSLSAQLHRAELAA